MKKFMSMFTKCENPKDKAQREECIKIEKEKKNSKIYVHHKAVLYEVLEAWSRS